MAKVIEIRILIIKDYNGEVITDLELAGFAETLKNQIYDLGEPLVKDVTYEILEQK
jgi:hypothetical protein